MFFEKIIHGVGSTFSHKQYPYFTMPWHYHPEYELIIITKGCGKRFVGSYIDEFHEGDILLIGEYLPHFHMCYELVNNNINDASSCEVIQFTKEIFPDKIDNIYELSNVNEILKLSKFGIKFINHPGTEWAYELISRLDSAKGATKVSELYNILEVLYTQEYKLLNPSDHNPYSLNIDTKDTINIVYKYLMDHFKNDNISLKEIANNVGLNETALCRHFKKSAQKTIFGCLMEIRIGYACKLIANTNLSISQVAYESGFKNISNFNRHFKNIMKIRPSRYRILYKSNCQSINDEEEL